MKKLIEITRSFTFKKNLGNYQSADFFMSQKAECYEDEAEKISEAIHEFCKKEVMKSVNGFTEEKKEVKEDTRETIDLSKFIDGTEKSKGVPNCSICHKPMKKSQKSDKYYCKHGEEWGIPIYYKPVDFETKVEKITN